MFNPVFRFKEDGIFFTVWRSMMGKSRVWGPEGRSVQLQELNDGTMIRRLSPCPGPTCIASKLTPSQLAPVPTDLDWEQIKQDMQQHENLIVHMYLDSENNVTVGVGNMLPSLASAQTLGFVVRNSVGKAATTNQIKTDWDRVNVEAGKKLRATYFAKVTLLDLPEETCWDLLKRRIDEEFLPGVKAIFIGWNQFPTPAKRALLDMAYNLGTEGLKKYKKLINHVENGYWNSAADECWRNGIPEERNEWTRARFLEALPPGWQK